MDSMKAFVYFAENEVVKDMLPNWPPEMRLALGLHKSGECELVVFHRNEAGKIIKRMGGVFNLPVGSFGVVPEKQGYPTKTMRFSDQQLLLKLITAEKGLCEIASDYAINYRFAEEEGLDPLHFTSLAYKGKKPLKRSKPKEPALVVAFQSRRLPPNTDTGKKKTDTYYEGTFVEIALIENHGKHIRLTLNPETASNDLPVLKATKVGRRDEQGQFVLERALLGKWQAGASVIIDIPVAKLFGRLSSNYFDFPHIEAVIVVPHGIFVTYNLEIKSKDAISSDTPPISYPFHKGAIRGLTFTDNQKMYR